MKDNKSVPNILREMERNEQVHFPLSQKQYVQNVICGRLEDERRSGKVWSVKTCRDDNEIIVTRTA